MGIQFHFLVNHIGVVGIPIGLMILGLGTIRREVSVQRVALMVLMVAGLSVGLASWSGELAEDQANPLTGISKSQVDRHEDAAEVSEVVGIMLAGISGITLLAWNRPYRRVGIGLVVAIGMVATVSLGYTAHQGGLIRHIELLPGGVGPGGTGLDD